MTHDMASQVSHIGAYAAAGLGLVGSVIAQAAPNTDVGQAGLIVGAGNLTVALILVVREVVPPVMNYAQARAASRDEYVKAQVEMEILTKRYEAGLAEIETLKDRLEVAQQDAREARNLVENAQIAADARAEAIELKAREAGHLARNNAQRIANVENTLGSSSGIHDIGPDPGAAP